VSQTLGVVIVTGLSGSGKSTAIRVLEDIGCYCIDNLPVVLIPNFLELCRQSTEISRVALGVDLREREFLRDFPRILDRLQEERLPVEVLFLDASDDALVRRFSETRRPHPLARDGSLTEGIALEREKLLDMRGRASRILDTTALTVHQLRDELLRLFGPGRGEGTLSVSLVSFGYKYGPPKDADVVFDARFLVNPYFVSGLRELDGRDPAVADFVLQRPEAREFLDRIVALLDFTLPLHQREGRAYLTVAVGCTGGRHRSVALVESLGYLLGERGYRVQLRHRDLGR
jgi:RNase adapter protein RapZ